MRKGAPSTRAGERTGRLRGHDNRSCHQALPLSQGQSHLMLVATYKVRGPSIYTWGNCGLGHEVLAWARRAKGRAGCEPGSLAPWPLAGWPQHLSPHIRGQLPALLSSTRASRQGLHLIASGHPTLPAPPVGMRRSRPWSLLAQVRGHSQRSQCSWSSHLCLESHPPWPHCPSPLRH